MEFSRQGCWNGSLFPSPGDLPDPGIEPGSPTLQTDSLPWEPPGMPADRTGDQLPIRVEENVSNMLVSWKAVAIDAIDLHRGLTGLDIYFGYSECIQNCCWAGWTRLHITDVKWAQKFWTSEPGLIRVSEAVSNTEQNADATNGFPHHQWHWRCLNGNFVCI